MRQLFSIIFCLVAGLGYSQTVKPQIQNDLEPSQRDQSIQSVNRDANQETSTNERKRPPINTYKIISIENDTTYVDTSLTINKYYKWDYLRRDDFELLPFANVGQPYNELGYEFNEVYIAPKFGARAKHFNHLEVEDISYYNVSTPWTELYYKTVIEQGQNLDALFTSNTSPQLNFFVAYKGLRSLGKYQASLSSVGNLRLGFSYNTKNKRYYIKTHFAAQDYTNDENGGLTAEAIQQYINEISEFEDRSLLEVNFQDAESAMDSRRFYLDHKYYIVKSTDSIPNNELIVGHRLNFTDKELSYRQAAPSQLFGASFESASLSDLTEFQDIYNEGRLTYNNNLLGRLTLKTGYTDFNYGYNRTVNTENGFVNNRLTGNIIQVGAEYRNNFGRIEIGGDIATSISGDQSGNYLSAFAKYQTTEDIDVRLKISTNDRPANYNFRLFQSDYINYNWQNGFSNESYQDIEGRVTSDKYGELVVSNTVINDYAYFGLNEEGLTRPVQHDGTINYLKVKLQNTLTFGLFGVANTVMYQNVASGAEIFNVPDIVTRHSLYYQDYWFKKALFLQTGITGKYFSSYNANGYDPILSDFYVQNEFELEGFPTLDFFFNAKIRQARVFFKLENASTIFLGNNNFSAPEYPYRDFVIRFGLVWDFFL